MGIEWIYWGYTALPFTKVFPMVLLEEIDGQKSHSRLLGERDAGRQISQQNTSGGETGHG